MRRRRGLAFITAVSAAVSLLVLLLARGIQMGFEAIGWQIEPAFSYVASAVILVVVATVWHLGTRDEDDK